jgi:hypothetical protein
MNHRQYQLIDYLREENRVLPEHLCGRRLRFGDWPSEPNPCGTD